MARSLLAAALLASTAAYMAYSNLSFKSILGLTQPGGIWRLLAIVFALLNLKSLPFGWHVRVFYGLLRHVSLSRRRVPKPHPPGALFQPVITSSYCTVGDMDYNMHKSNSTYFLDLDVSRMHHLSSLMRLGMHKVHFQSEPREKDEGKFHVALGGVTCTFKKEIKPYQGFEVWTRVLSWDKKWLYVVCHIVKRGAVKPKSYTLQPWKKGAKPRESGGDDKGVNGLDKGGKAPHPAIIAVSVAKYVFKRGRKTIPPEEALRAAELLPPKPESDLKSPQTPPETPIVEGSAPENAIVGVVSNLVPDAQVRRPSLEVNLAGWSWDNVEAERLKGMDVAQHMGGIDKALDAWTGDERAALGEF